MTWMCQDQQAELRFLKSKVENRGDKNELEILLPHSRSGSKSSSCQGELEIVGVFMEDWLKLSKGLRSLTFN